MSQKAVFLDRDDTLIQDPGYISRPEQVKLMPGAAHALWQLKKMGFLVIVVSNQSGVARGLITIDQLEEVSRQLTDLLSSEGVYLDGLYYCPYHPDGTVSPYNCESDLRKPKPGMLLLAAKEKEIDFSKSWMIGDSYRDIKAGQAAGCHTILVDVPGKPRVKQADEPEPERKAVNLREAVNVIRMFEFHQKAQRARSTVHEEPQPAPAIEQTAAFENKTEPELKDVTIKSQLAPEPQNLMQPEKTSEPAEKPAEPATITMPKTEPAKQSDLAEQVMTEKQTSKPLPRDLDTAGETEPVIAADTVKKTVETASQPQTGDKITSLLEEILQRLKSDDRKHLYHEFSIFKLIAMMLQMIAVFCLIASVGFWLSAKGGTERVFILIGYSIALQLVVIALMMMEQDN